jgi:hypothetical protein
MPRDYRSSGRSGGTYGWFPLVTGRCRSPPCGDTISGVQALSFTILATLILILLAAVSVFEILSRRATAGRKAAALREWAVHHGAQVIARPWQDKSLSGLEMLESVHPRGRNAIEGPNWSLAELSTDPPHTAKGKTPCWRLLAWQTQAHWPPTGLRPALHAVSVLDLFDLSSFPSLAGEEGFMVFGSDPAAAKTLAASRAQNQLPSDVGLLMHGRTLILDFSNREFSRIELERMLALVERLAGHLSPAR